jgi:hypothetical protein
VHFVVLNTYSASTDPATNYTGWIGFQSDTVGGSRTVRVSGKNYTYSNSPQADWLIGTLDTAKPWTVVVMHHALFDAYSTGAYSPANQSGGATSTNKYYYGERNRLLAFFAAHGVDVVLQGHNHNYRRHVERVSSADGSVVSEMTFLTQATSGGPPTAYQRDTSDSGGDYYLPALDWIDLNGNGVPDNGEPPATGDNSSYWDAAWFGQRNSLRSASGYFGITPDEFHATGEEFDNGISFSYSLFQTGSDAHGDPSLTLTVKRVSWSASTNAWGPWTDFETLSLPQVDDGMTADRLTGS